MDETTITRVKEMLEALRVNLQNDGGDLELVKRLCYISLGEWLLQISCCFIKDF